MDGAGRLKLPAKVLEVLGRLAEKTLFVTKLKGMARIYTNGSWERNLDKLNGLPQLRKSMAIEADRYGADVELDPQGRITLPQAMRKEMGLEDEQVYLRFYEDVIFVYTQGQYAAEVDAAAKVVSEGMEQAEALGFV